MPADPIVIRPHRGGREFVTIDEQEITPAVRPVIDELRSLKQRVDESIAFVRGLVCEEGAGFLERGQHADGVEIGASQELMILGAFGWRDVQLAQFFQSELVDEVSWF